MRNTIFIPIWLVLAAVARSQAGSSYEYKAAQSNSYPQSASNSASGSSSSSDSSYSSSDDNDYYDDDTEDEDSTDTGIIDYTTLDPSIQSAAEKYNNDLLSYATANPTRDIFYEIYEAASYPATQTPDPLAELAASFAEGVPAPSGALSALPTSLRPAAESFLNSGAAIAASDLAGNPALASAVRSQFQQDLTDYSYTTLTGNFDDTVSSSGGSSSSTGKAALTAASTAPSTTSAASSGSNTRASSSGPTSGASTTLSTRATATSATPSSTTSVLAASSNGASPDNAIMQYRAGGALAVFLAFVALL